MSLATYAFRAHVLGYAPGDVVELDKATDGLRDVVAASYAAVSTDPITRAPTQEHEEMKAIRASLAPFRVNKADAGITLTGAAAWVDVDPAGTSAARPLDLVIEDVEIGDWVEAYIDAHSVSDPDPFYLDFFPIVNGVPSGNHFWTGMSANANSGPQGWWLAASAAVTMSHAFRYQVRAGDIDAQGNLRLRLRHWGANAVTRILGVTFSGFSTVLEARGPFGPRPSST